MKLLLSMFVCWLTLLTFPVYANLYQPTDTDVDFTLDGDLVDPTAFFAFVTEGAIDEVSGTLAGGGIAVPLPLGPISGQIKVVEFPGVFAHAVGTAFEVGLWYDDEWSKPTEIVFQGGDTWRFHWAPDDWAGETATIMVSDVGVVQPSAVPIPPAAWLLGSGFIGMMGVARRGLPTPS